MSSPRLTNKHAEEILNMSCMPVLGQPHIQVDISPTTEIARINMFATTAKKYLMGKRAYNASVTGRFVERQRNKTVPLTHWLYGTHSPATLLFVNLVNHPLTNEFLSIAAKLRFQPQQTIFERSFKVFFF